MKKLSTPIWLFLSILWFGNTCFAQGDDYYNPSSFQHYQQSEILTNPTVQAPDVAAFQKVNFIPVSNYTGRANISVPIFTIQSGNISVPISLSYNSSGVKVNDVPSNVGSNWALNATGMVSKVVKGMDDFDMKHTHNQTIEFDHYCGRMGFVYQKYHNYEGADIAINGNDNLPDVFLVNAPGLSTQYIHTDASRYTPAQANGTSGDIFELTGQQNKIVETLGEQNYGLFDSSTVPSGNWFLDHSYIDGNFIANASQSSAAKWNLGNHFGIQSLAITNTSGVLYEFNKPEVSQYTYTYKTKDPVKGLSKRRIRMNIKQESYKLTKIKDSKSNKEVFFDYESYHLGSYDPVDTDYFFDGNLSPFNDEGEQTPKSTKYVRLHRLKKIRYDNGSVEFVYGLNRQDVVGEKALTQVIVKDRNGLVIKKVHFSYGYFQNNAYANTPQNKRLKLNEVYTTNASNKALPKYKFTYNTTPLPPRGVWGKDFLGYHNGSYTTAISNAKPKVYFYPDKGLYSFLPQSIGGNYYLLNGQYSLAANINYAKAGILEKIQYPTGGFSEFTYELNQFKVQNSTISGGGLRIKSQKIKDEHGNEQVLDYQYKETDNSSSGRMVSMPNFIDFRVRNTYLGNLNPASAANYFSFKTYRAPQTQAEFTGNAFVGYARVVVKNRINNGYIEYNYTSPKDFANAMHLYTTSGSDNHSHRVTHIARSNGKRSSTFSKEVYRGRLKSKKVYNKSGTKLTEVVNSYTYKKHAEQSFNNPLALATTFNYMNIAYHGPELVEQIKIPSERYLLTQSVATQYLEGGSTSSTQQNTYDATYPFLKENKVIDGSKTVINKYFYPHDNAVKNRSYIGSLRNQNRFSERIQQEAYQDGQKIFTERIHYHNFGNNLFLAKEIGTAKGTETLEVGAVIDKRDAKGNILQYHTQDGVYTSFIYGYGNTQLLAKVENATYSTAISKLPISIGSLQSLDSKSNQTTLISYFNTLRSRLPNAKVTSYTYIPSVGVSTITDDRGKTMTYVYDEFHRLGLIKDIEGKIVKRIEYNHKN